MITENSILTGMNGSTYRIGTQIGVGGEGIVYAVQGTQLVAKIYKNVDPEVEGKLRYMVNHPIPQVVDQNGNPILNAAWPQDLLYDGHRSFVGYVMPRIETGVEIFQVERGCTAPKVKAKFPNYSWRLNVLVARNLAASVNILHKQGYILGDMNCKNFLVNTDGSISLLDTDSIDMTDPNTGKHYKCCVGMEDYLPPELQGRNLRSSNARYTPQTDDFALAIHIFQLLMNNYHPFSGKQTVVKSSSSACGRMQQIAEGKCPYLHTYPDLTIPVGAPRLEAIVPDYIITCFRNTFDYNSSNAYTKALSRTTAEQWTNSLRQLLQECDAPGGLVRCRNDASHYYLRSKGSCGICAAQKSGTTGSAGAGSRSINSGTTGGNTVQPTKQTKVSTNPKGKWSNVFIMCWIGVLFTLLTSNLSPVQDYKEPEQELMFISELEYVPASVEALVAQGTRDCYRYRDGSRVYMYFENDLERCRIYVNKDRNVEYISTAEYNSGEKPLKHVLYDGQGVILRTDTYAYDADNKLMEHIIYGGTEEESNRLERTEYTYMLDGRDSTVTTYAFDGARIYQGLSTYDDEGNELYQYFQYSGTDDQRKGSGQIQYDAQGNVISNIGYDAFGQVSYWCQYQYNAVGKESGGAYFNPDGTLQSSWTVDYKLDGREEGESHYDAENERSETIDILYGPRDEIMGYQTYVPSGGLFTNEYVESLAGVTIKGISSSFADGDHISHGRSYYDIMGHYIEYTSHDDEGNLISQTTYTLDQYGYDTGSTFRYYRGDGTVSVSVYDADGNEISSKRYDAAGNELE